MMQIIIQRAEAKRFTGTSKVSGKPYNFQTQTAYMYTYDDQGNRSDFPEKVELTLESNQEPYPKGVYILAPHSFYVDRNNRLSISPKLIPAPPPAK